MNETLRMFIETRLNGLIVGNRKELLDEISKDLMEFYSKEGELKLNFICTHNSRRSQFAQVWAWILANYYDLPNMTSFSGGTEVTAVYPSVIRALESIGVKVNKEQTADNPIYTLSLGEGIEPLKLYSKLYDTPENPNENFLAFMTCSSVDEGCPLVAGAAKRYRLTYEDPKFSDGTEREKETYLEKCIEIGRELNMIFKLLGFD